MKNHSLGLSHEIACFALTIMAVLSPYMAQAQTTDTTTTTTETVTTTTPKVIAPSAGDTGDIQEVYERGLIEEVRTGAKSSDSGGEQVDVYRVKLLGGPIKGETRDIESSVATNPYQLNPHIGDKVVIFMQKSPGDQDWQLYLEGFDRRAALIWLVVIFFLSLVFLSGWQGMKVFISIAISIAVIGFVLIPLFLRGIPPVPTAIVIMGLMIFISTGLSTGWNKISIITALGTIGGALAAYGIATLFVDWAHLTGINSSEEDRMFFRDNPTLNPRGLLLAGIIIAAAGAAEDVAVSIASAAREVKKNNPHATYKEIFTSAMVVGKDHMAALSNTLIFAYVGASLSTLLLYTQFGGSWLKFINFDAVADEVIRALAGTIGIALTVPITAVLASWIIVKEKISPKPHS